MEKIQPECKRNARRGGQGLGAFVCAKSPPQRQAIRTKKADQ